MERHAVVIEPYTLLPAIQGRTEMVVERELLGVTVGERFPSFVVIVNVLLAVPSKLTGIS